MKIILLALNIILLAVTVNFAQENPLEKFSFLVGNWEGNGTGFGSSKSKIHSEFNMVLDNNFLEIRNHSEFEAKPQQKDGEIHDDWGMLSFDQDRKIYVFRQFHNEGFYNQYTLSDSLSNDKTFVFESEFIENFVPGGRARFTINIIGENEIETLFDVGFPEKELACFGTNRLKKK